MSNRPGKYTPALKAFFVFRAAVKKVNKKRGYNYTPRGYMLLTSLQFLSNSGHSVSINTLYQFMKDQFHTMQTDEIAENLCKFEGDGLLEIIPVRPAQFSIGLAGKNLLAELEKGVKNYRI